MVLRLSRRQSILLTISLLLTVIVMNINLNRMPKDGKSKEKDDGEVTTFPPINMTAIMDLMDERRENVLKTCSEVLSPSERQNPVNSKEFLISNKYKLIWCNIFKSASSSWLYNFVKMSGPKENKLKKAKGSPIECARKIYERPSVEKLTSYLHQDNYTSFIIVRDPFERLLSAYRDKLESHKQSYYKSLRCKIHGNFSYKKSGKSDCNPSFPEFVDYLVDENLKGNHPNEHWAPYNKFCSPCQVQFDYILHFETLAQDEAFLINAVDGLSSVLTPFKLHSSNTNYEKVTQSYFRLLTREQLEKLYHIYEKDFKIFNYNADKYFLYIP